MYRKYFFKNKGVLSRRFVASGLAAVFSAGMFGSYAGAMESDVVIQNINNIICNISDNQEKYKENKRAARNFVKRKVAGKSVEEIVSILGQLEGDLKEKLIGAFLKKRKELIDFFVELSLRQFRVMKEDMEYVETFEDFDNKVGKHLNLSFMFNRFIENLRKENKYSTLINMVKNKTLAIAILIVVVAIILAVKGNSNPGDPNNKDDEKINPSTDPESDDQNPEQKRQGQKKTSVGIEFLKEAGVTVTAVTSVGGGTFLVNEVLLKRGKSSEVKNPKNVNGKHMSLDSDENEVKKTLESEKTHDNYDTDDENANNSGTKQLLEDKDAGEKEEGQEEILESSALSDDTEVTSDEDKNKD